MNTKLQNQHGFTLMETVATVAILALIVLAIGTGMNGAMKVYHDANTIAEADVLASTVMQTIADEIRWADSCQTADAENSTANDGQLVFSNVVYGNEAVLKVAEDEEKKGMLAVEVTELGKEYPLLPMAAYPQGLRIASLTFVELRSGQEGQAFEVTVEIKDDEEIIRSRAVQQIEVVNGKRFPPGMAKYDPVHDFVEAIVVLEQAKQEGTIASNATQIDSTALTGSRRAIINNFFWKQGIHLPFFQIHTWKLYPLRSDQYTPFKLYWSDVTLNDSIQNGQKVRVMIYHSNHSLTPYSSGYMQVSSNKVDGMAATFLILDQTKAITDQKSFENFEEAYQRFSQLEMIT